MNNFVIENTENTVYDSIPLYFNICYLLIQEFVNYKKKVMQVKMIFLQCTRKYTCRSHVNHSHFLRFRSNFFTLFNLPFFGLVRSKENLNLISNFLFLYHYVIKWDNHSLSTADNFFMKKEEKKLFGIEIVVYGFLHGT